MMRCPKCGAEKTRIFDNVSNMETNEQYRRRRCTECSHIFFTIEFEVEETDQFKEDWKKSHRTYVSLEKQKKKRSKNLDACDKCGLSGSAHCETCDIFAARRDTIGKLLNKE